jgi:hypothetical protein
MEMKPHEKPLGHNPLSNAPYRNLGMVLNRQGLGRTPLVARYILIWIQCQIIKDRVVASLVTRYIAARV